MFKKIISFQFVLLLILFSCSACGIKHIEKRGYVFEASEYENLQEGITTKDRVLSMMGSPTLISYFNQEELWIYYHEDIRELLFFKPKVVARKIITLKFDSNNTIKELKSYDLSSQKDMAFVKDITPIETHEEMLIHRLISNIGQVRPL